jgi:CRISPR-associated endonuclease Csn1
MGVRIFGDGRDPKTLTSRAADRRLARQARRRRDRLLKRRKRMMEGLVRFGLMPATVVERKALQEIDPYELRAKGLDSPLTLHELGRALFHLCRKRGFHSSRKELKQDEKETGKVKVAISELREKISATGCRTVGEYLACEHAERRPVRGRRRTDGSYVLYLQRDMVADEFDRLWEAQRPHHFATLTDEARDCLRDILLFQRKLLPVTPGRCLFEEEEFRARLSSPLQQNFRLLQELNNLRLVSERETRALTLEERNILFKHMQRNMKATFASLRTLIGIRKNASTRFNLEQENRRDLKGDLVAAQFSKPECIGEDWFSWPAEKQQRLAELIAITDDYGALYEQLISSPWSFSNAQAKALASCSLPDDFGALSLKALRKIVPELQNEVITYDVAVKRAGYDHHSALHTGEIFDQLPYYGQLLRNYTSSANKAKNDDERQYGKISNPTVHIGLNQLRQLVNALSRRYGPPHQIVIELTREFGLGPDKRREWISIQNENRERNQRYDDELRRLGQPVTRENRQRLQLWNELGRDDALNRVCVYTGKGLSVETLFSAEVEIDHVLPFSRSLHDGIGNKILCVRQANREKGNRTPSEAFSHSPPGYDWNAILNRAATLPGRKASLFQEDALQKFLGENSFLERHLNDTAYLSRVARQYLSYICHKDNVWVSTGKLTAMLRGKFRLNELLSSDGGKNRDDHRHHALDAAVIGLCSRSLIQRISTAAERAERAGEQRLLEGLQLPWPAYREDVRTRLARVIPSHKPDHSKQAALHNDTNYGLRAVAVKGIAHTVTHRKPLIEIKPTELDGIADRVLRERLRIIFEKAQSTKELKAALEKFSTETGVRRVRIDEKLAVIPIGDRRTHQPYRYVKGDGNYCYEIFDAGNGRWDGEVISYYIANQKTYSESARESLNGKPLLFRIQKNDLIAVEETGRRRILRVAKFSDGRIELVDARDARTRENGLQYIRKSPSVLQLLKARMVGVDILGYINDPGFKE